MSILETIISSIISYGIAALLRSVGAPAVRITKKNKKITTARRTPRPLDAGAPTERNRAAIPYEIIEEMMVSRMLITRPLSAYWFVSSAHLIAYFD
jgi:hypothetical protein